MGWISVEDRLPKVGDFVVGYEKGEGIIFVCIRMLGVEGSDGHWYISKGDELYWADFTHWMPLPDPPKEG
jgi:hypothetical protein